MTYGNLTEGQTLNGFKTAAVYLDDSDHAIGARFRHVRTGFTLDLLEIQSVPQTFIWTTTYPTSNMGEPHTQEHLLLGKGNKGRELASGGGAHGVCGIPVPQRPAAEHGGAALAG